MIESKKELANLTVSVGENWISNLSNDEIKDIFRIDQQWHYPIIEMFK